jgi:hypothetical protein
VLVIPAKAGIQPLLSLAGQKSESGFQLSLASKEIQRGSSSSTEASSGASGAEKL